MIQGKIKIKAYKGYSFNGYPKRWVIKNKKGESPFGNINFKTPEQGWKFIREKIKDDKKLDEYSLVLKWRQHDENNA
jgi:hypothetical protein